MSQNNADWFLEYLSETEPQKGGWQPPEPQHLDFDISKSPPWSIGPCIQPGDCAYLVAQDGVGKSSLVADLILGILLPDQQPQTCFAGAWRINPEYLPPFSDILVVNAETSGADSWGRLLRYAAVSRGLSPSSEAVRHVLRRTWYIHAQEAKLDGTDRERACESFARWIVSQGFRLVIFDPVFNVFSPADNADATWVNHGLRPIVNILKENGINLLCIAHPAADSQQFGRKGGPSLDRLFTPFGTSQQRNIIDCRFGLRRDGKNNRLVHLYKLKDRRASWIPQKARISLTFGPDGGYIHAEGHETWHYDNPDPVVLSKKAREILALLPYPEPFRISSVKGIDRRAFNDVRDSFFLPAEILLMRQLKEKGAPIEYIWTQLGAKIRKKVLDEAKGHVSQ